jgi:hypothetical protein
VIADVAGYYAPGNDKFLSLDVFGTDDGSALFTGGFGPQAGLEFLDAVTDGAGFHFVLPPDYTAGTDLVATFTWHTASTGCVVSWRPQYASVSRAGEAHPVGATPFAGLVGPGDVAVTVAGNVVQATTFTMTTPTNAFVLQPGDSYTFNLSRQGANGTDTCISSARMDSFVVRYE